MKRGERLASAWGGPEVGSRTWVLPGFTLGREALGKDAVRGHTPPPRLLPMRSAMSWARCPQMPLTPTRKESPGSSRLNRAASRAQCPDPTLARYLV